MSGGKDGRTCIFNVSDGQIVSEMPSQPGFVIQAKFNPRHPELITVATVEGGSQVYNMMGEPRHDNKNFISFLLSEKFL